MTAVIVSTPFGTRPYTPPKLDERLCPLDNFKPCVEGACPAWRGSLYGCGLLEARK